MNQATPAAKRRQRELTTRGATYRRLLRYLRPHRWRIALAGVCLLGTTATGLTLPLGAQQLVDSVLVERNLSLLNWLAVALIALFLLRAALDYLQGFLINRVAQRVVADLRSALFARLLSLPLPRFANELSGQLTARIINDTNLMLANTTQGLLGLVQQILTLGAGIILLFALDWRLASLTLAAAPIALASILLLGRRIRRSQAAILKALAAASGVVAETSGEIRVVKAFDREPYESGRFDRRVEEIYRWGLNQARLRLLLGPIMLVVGFGATALILWFGGRLVIAGELTPGQLVAFLAYLLLVTGPISGLVSFYGQMQEALGAADRVFDLLDSPAEPSGVGPALERPVLGAVRLEHISFGYDPARPVLKDVSLELRPGEVVAIVGPSGAGKTTLANLLPRFYDPQAGQITFDGRDLRELPLEDLRAQIALVPQETNLFSTTIRENLAYGNLAASEAQIVAAARAAAADEFIRATPDGYDSVVGERGIKLSGGQRQRIAIARALLKGPKLLILDEPTAFLDAESERLVEEALERLMRGRTTLIIAHRLATVRRADRIAVLADGHLVELGTHDELLALGGLYRRLTDAQLRERSGRNGRSADPSRIMLSE